MVSPTGYLWGTFDTPIEPTTGDHIYGPIVRFSTTDEFIAYFYDETATNYNANGPDAITNKLLQLDPFFLPFSTPVSLVSGTVDRFPHHEQLALVTPTEGIAVYETQTSTQTTLNLITGTSGANGLTFSAPVKIEGPFTGLPENSIDVDDLTTNNGATLSTYSVAWDQYNSTAHTYSVNFQIFNANGTTSSSVVNVFSNADVTGGVTSLPAWIFKAVDGHYELAIAQADPNNTGGQLIELQNYGTNGTLTSGSGTFDISADLTTNAATFGSDVTNAITLENQNDTNTGFATALQLGAFSASAPNPHAIAVAWNETVTGSNGTFDQVELALYTPGGTEIKQLPILIPDADPQNVRLDIVNDIGVLAYGDDTGTHLIEFNSAGNVLATYDEATTQTYQTITALGDGRVAITYDTLPNSGDGDTATSQLVTHVVDFRTTGLSNPTLSDTPDAINYIAGTEYSDTVTGATSTADTGANGVNNIYYYIGQQGAATAPTDSFTGGGNGSGGWNAVIFAGTESDYNWSPANNTNGTGNITGSGAYAGTLDFANIQELVFSPSQSALIDGSDNTIIASPGSTDILLTQYVDPVGHGTLLQYLSPAEIMTGATLELDTAFDNNVTFDGAQATLQIDDPVNKGFFGEIGGLAVGDAIDLVGIDATTATVSGTVLTVDTTGSPLIYDLSAALASGINPDLEVRSDGNGGSLLVVHGTAPVAWAAAVSGKFGDATKWTPQTVPSTIDNAEIAAKGSAAYTVTSTADQTVQTLVMAKNATLTADDSAFAITGGTGAKGALAGTINVDDSSSLTLGDGAPANSPVAFNNTGTIVLNTIGSDTDLVISGAVALTGKGKVTLVDFDNQQNVNNDIVSNGQAASLANAGTISGAGFVGDANLTVDNQSKGIIDATGPGALVLEAAVSNQGKIEASSGTLVVASTIDNTTPSASVATVGGGSFIELQDGGNITGGKVSIPKGGMLTGIDTQTISSAVTNAGTLSASGELIVNGTVSNTGMLTASGAGHLQLNGAVKGGTAELSNGGTIEFGASDTKITTNVSFQNTGVDVATLQFDAAATSTPTAIYTGTITVVSGSNSTDFVDFAGLTYAGNNTVAAKISGKDTLVTVTEGADAVSFKLLGTYIPGDFAVSQDSGTGTKIGIPTPDVAAHAVSAQVQAIAAFAPAAGSGSSSVITAADHNTPQTFLAANSH